MFDYLKKMKDLQKLVCIYTDFKESNTFYVGYIAALNEKELVLQEISKTGKYCGYLWIPLDAVYRCETDSKYTKKIECLSAEEVPGYPALGLDEESDLRRQLLRYAKQNHIYIECRWNERLYTGYLLEFTKTRIVLNNADEEINCFSAKEIDFVEIEA